MLSEKMQNIQGKVIFKINHGDDLRRFTCDAASVAFDTVLDRATQLFSTGRDTTFLRYFDDEGDWITLSSDDDLQEAIFLATQHDSQKIIIRVDVTWNAGVAIGLVGVAGLEPADGPNAFRVAELEEAVHRLENEAKEQAAMITQKSNQAAKVHSRRNKASGRKKYNLSTEQMATEFLQKEPKVVQELSQAVDTRTPHTQEQIEQAILADSVHTNVICDGCDMNPLAGCRYNKKGRNYDLCSTCFSQQPFESLHHIFSHECLYQRITRPGDTPVEVEVSEEAVEIQEQQVHTGIWCDVCKAHPIRGERYMQQLEHDTYDVCQDCFYKLDDEQKVQLHAAVSHPEALVVKEAVVEEAVVEEATPACTLQDALHEMGMAEGDISASMIAGIEQMVDINAQAAEEAVMQETSCKAAAEEEARLAAKESEARLAAEEAAAAACMVVNPTMQPLINQLTGMGFSEEASQKAIVTSNGDVEEALNILVAFPEPEADEFTDDSTALNEEWGNFLDELTEMGFEDAETNRRVLAEVHGDVKEAVKQLVILERAGRQ